MHIALDTRILSYNNSGISRYINGLIPELLLQNKNNTFFEINTFKSKIKTNFNLKKIKVLSFPHSCYENFLLPLELSLHNLDYFHAFDFYASVPQKTNLISSVYDFYFLKSTEANKGLSYYRRSLKYIQNAHTVIACSDSTRSDAIELLNINPEKCITIYPGFEYQTWEDDLTKIQTPPTDYEYILFVGTLEKRKNLNGILSGYKMAKDKLKETLPRLIIAGRYTDQYKDIRNKVLKLNLENDVIFKGECTNQELKCLYKYANFLIYPSLYEGFGFPILEAWASKIPVLTSNNSSMKEIANGASELIEPNDSSSIAEGIISILSDSEKRFSYIKEGYNRLVNFTWKEAAKKTLNLYGF